jgi:hypothetical protein
MTFKINQILNDERGKKKLKIIQSKEKQYEDGFFYLKKRIYMALLLKGTQQINIKISRLDSLSSPSLKLTCMKVDLT